MADHETYLVSLRELPEGICARLYHPDRNGPKMLAQGHGSCEESAIAAAAGRPRMRFQCADDEVTAVRACMRHRLMSLAITPGGMRCLGIN